MKRGEIWKVSGGPDYAGKPRPAVIVQHDRFDMTASLTICALTTATSDSPLLRVAIEPTPENGLRALSWLMIDKITTASKTKLGARLGRLRDDDLIRLNRAMIVFLGMAG